MNYHVFGIHGLVLSVGCVGDVGELDNLFNIRKYGRDQVSRMVRCLIDNVLALKEFVRHKLTVVLLEVSEHILHGVIDGVHRAIVDIRNICLPDCGNYFCARAF